MGWFVFAVIFGIIGAVLLSIGQIKWDDLDANRSISLRLFAIIPLVLLVVCLILSMLRTVGAGDVGVPVTFGKAGSPLQSGVHFVAPWTGVKTLSIQDQNYTMSHTNSEGAQNGNDTVPVNTKDNANVDVDSTVIYRVSPLSAQKLYVNLGADYVNKIVRPTIRSSIRDQAVNFTAVDLTTSGRAQYEVAVQNEIEQGLSRYNVQIRDVKIRDIILPQSVQQAVNEKVAAQQFVLLTTQQQAQQKIAEAQGLAQAQQIIHSTLTPEYLQYQYIQTLQSLAKSPNTTFLFVPNNPNGLPNFQLPLPGK